MMTTPARIEGMTRRGDDPAAVVAPSAAALAANARLQELRQALAASLPPRRPPVGLDLTAAESRPPRPSPVDRAQVELEARRAALGIFYRRPGGVDAAADFPAAPWASTRTSAAPSSRPLLQRAGGQVGRALGAAGDVCAQTLDELAGVEATVYPSLAAAFLASKHVAPVGRLWLLLRAWDTAGRGCHGLDQLYQVFTVEGSPWRVADRRQVQRLIKAGAGIFWTLRDHRSGRFHKIQMHGPARVAGALEVARLAGDPVRVPVAELLDGMHRASAALYAATLTLRQTRRKKDRPITQRKLADMTGRAPSTQRTYTRTARIDARPNYVILPAGDVDARGVFLLRDHTGQQGKAGRVYLARHMANSYRVPLPAASRGRQRKINRQLTLVTNEARGDGAQVDYRPIYHETAGQAARAYGRDYRRDHFWIAGQTAAGAGLWHVVEAVQR